VSKVTRASVAGTDLLARIDAGRAPAIIDVRSAWEYRNGHVPGAIHLPFWTIGTRIAEIPAEADDEVVVYCGHGPRAWRAGRVLSRHGFTRVTYLKGHMHAWRQANLREESNRS
jgi:rhodanese-related sulfurtransferase